MKKLLVIVLAVVSLILWPVTTLAADVSCPEHPGSSCYDTGRVSRSNADAHLYHCSCGDNIWVED